MSLWCERLESLQKWGFTGDAAQLVECLHSLQEASNHSKPGVMAHTSHPSIWEVEEGVLEVQGHHWLHNELETSLGSMRPCLKNKNKAKRKAKIKGCRDGLVVKSNYCS